MTFDLADFDLAAAMRSLYETGDYFYSIPARKTSYEDDYWGEIVDPDGKRRDRSREREQHLSDIAGELAYMEDRPGGRLLDVGCGLGWLLSALGGKWERHGLELSKYAAERAGAHADVFSGPLLAYEGEEGSFDLIVMHHVIEHMEDPRANIRRIRELLKPGGRLVLGTPDFDSGCARRFGNRFRLLHDPTHVSLFSSESMHRFLRDHGFRIEKVEHPFFGTRHFTRENLMRLFETDEISPPFYGNFMTFYVERLS